jgi:hypothetical protein
VSKLVRHLLFFVVIFGLAGNGVAMAYAPCPMLAKAIAAPMADMPGCDMAKASHDNPADHGKGMKPGCMMMAGCNMALAIKDRVAASDTAQISYATEFWPVATTLSGRIVAPEPEPPTLLG